MYARGSAITVEEEQGPNVQDENNRLRQEVESLKGLLQRYERRASPRNDDTVESERPSVEEYDISMPPWVSPEEERQPQVYGEPEADIYAEPDDGLDKELETSFQKIVLERGMWLVGLMIVQSLASIIIQRNEAILEQHVVIVRFLTMVVGAGGNAGNQSAVGVIRGLAIGTIRRDTVKAYLKKEFAIGMCLTVILCIAGCLRATVSLTPIRPTMGIATSIFLVVIISVLLGATLPLGMKRFRIDPAHASTTISVIMDVIGVYIAIWIGTSPFFR